MISGFTALPQKYQILLPKRGLTQGEWNNTLLIQSNCRFLCMPYKVWLIIVIGRLHICKWVYMLKFILTPKSIPMVLVRSFTNTCRVVKTQARYTQSHERWNQATFCLPIAAIAVYTSVLFAGFEQQISSFLWLLLVILLFQIAPKQTAEVLSIDVKLKKIVLCLTKKICVLGKLGLTMS